MPPHFRYASSTVSRTQCLPVASHALPASSLSCHEAEPHEPPAFCPTKSERDVSDFPPPITSSFPMFVPRTPARGFQRSPRALSSSLTNTAAQISRLPSDHHSQQRPLNPSKRNASSRLPSSLGIRSAPSRLQLHHGRRLPERNLKLRSRFPSPRVSPHSVASIQVVVLKTVVVSRSEI